MGSPNCLIKKFKLSGGSTFETIYEKCSELYKT